MKSAMSDLTHLDADGNAVMVDISNKNITERSATAVGSVYMLPETLKLIVNSDVKKGDVVLFGKYSGTEVKIDNVEYVVMREDDIIGVVE